VSDHSTSKRQVHYKYVHGCDHGPVLMDNRLSAVQTSKNVPLNNRLDNNSPNRVREGDSFKIIICSIIYMLNAQGHNGPLMYLIMSPQFVGKGWPLHADLMKN